jgi:hypothetical protein
MHSTIKLLPPNTNKSILVKVLITPDGYSDGYYAIYEPNSKYNTKSFYEKKWHSNTNGKIINSALMFISVSEAKQHYKKYIETGRLPRIS